MTNTNTNADDADEQMKREIETILPGKDVFANLQVRRTGFVSYHVLSTRNSGITLHKVNLGEPSCSCDDWKYNLEDGNREICAHYAAAFIESDDVDTEDMALLDLSALISDVDDYRSRLDSIVSTAEKATVEARSASAEAQQTTANNSEPKSPDELKESFVDAAEASGFEVHFANFDGEELAFSVGHDNFDEVKRVTSQCDLVGYDGDANKLPMGDVETYVQEVLE